MKTRDFSKTAIAIATGKRVNWAIGLPLVLALGACGGGGGEPVADSAAANVLAQISNQRQTTSTAMTSTSTATSTTNLVSNSGFESGLTGWGNWGNAQAVTGQSASGSHSLRVGTAAGGVGQNVAGMIAGTSYHFSGKAKVSVAGETGYIGVKFQDATGATLLEKSASATTTSYAAVSLDAEAPANSATALVYVWKNAGSGYAYIDGVAFGAGSASPTPAPAPTMSPIAVASWPNTLLQTGFDTDAYWIEDNAWGAAGLTRGTYTGITGTTYEEYTGDSPNMGPNGDVSFRWAWKYPTGTTEVKAYPNVIAGRKPGYYNTWTNPAGEPIRLLNGTQSATYPSGATPGTFFPLQLPIASLKSTFNYTHLAAPTGHGHLTYDIWLQSTPTQIAGFSAPPISHEIMIPLNYWGGYGAYPTGRNPGWYDHDVTLDGRLFHVYVNKGSDGSVKANFGGGWKFIVFEPDTTIAPGTLNLAAIINYVATRKDAFGTPWANGNEYAVSVELGVEPVDGVGDLQITNYKVSK